MLVDTPALGSGGARRWGCADMVIITSAADGLLYVVQPSREMTSFDIEFLRRVHEICPGILVALSKVDAYVDWHRVHRADEELLGRRGSAGLEVLPLWADLRLFGLRSGDSSCLLESGFSSSRAGCANGSRAEDTLPNGGTSDCSGRS